MRSKAPTQFILTITIKVCIATGNKLLDKQAVVLAAYPKALRWSSTVRQYRDVLINQISTTHFKLNTQKWEVSKFPANLGLLSFHPKP